MPELLRRRIDNILCTSHRGLGHGKGCFPLNVDVLDLFSIVLLITLVLADKPKRGAFEQIGDLPRFSPDTPPPCPICVACALGSLWVFWPWFVVFILCKHRICFPSGQWKY